MKLKDLTGKRFGRLLVKERAENLGHNVRWLCVCDCGKETIVHSTSLKTGNTTSCGCYKAENARRLYSKSKSKDLHLYAVWNGIKQRCRNKNNISYPNYGGRGIDIDDTWADDYEIFYNWAIRSGYRKGLQIDRIDVNGNYCEENCRFVDLITQANNKRNVRLFTINGVSKTLPQWCREYKQNYYLARQRIDKLNWTIIDALTIPKLKPGQKMEGGMTDARTLRTERKTL